MLPLVTSVVSSFSSSLTSRLGLGVPVMGAAFFASSVGAVVCFAVNRQFAFRDPSPVRLEQIVRFALVAVASAGLTALAIVPQSTPAVRQARADALELTLVADDVSLDFTTAPLPRGASLRTEDVTVSPGATAARPYVRLVRGEGESMADARARLEAWVSQLPTVINHRVLLGKVLEEIVPDDRARDEEAGWRTYLVRSPAEITGADIAGAQAEQAAATGSAHVIIDLTPDAGARFAALTKANVRRRLAIVSDHEVMSAPVIRQEIAGGHVQVSMEEGTPEQQLADAKRLASKLRRD